MKQAIGYTRVSTFTQGQSHFGLNVQETQIKSFAQARGYRIRRTFHDVQTGRGKTSTNDRDGLQEALDLARKKRWPIIISDIDRLGRHEPSLLDLLNDPDLVIISANDGEGADKAILAGQAKRAQREGDLIARRTKEALERKKEELEKQGKRLGNPRILEGAQHKGAQAAKRKAEIRTLGYEEIIKELQGAGAKTARDFAKGLNERGLSTPRGEAWSADNVRRLLRRAGKAYEQQEIQETQKETPEFYRDNPDFGAY